MKRREEDKIRARQIKQNEIDREHKADEFRVRNEQTAYE